MKIEENFIIKRRKTRLLIVIIIYNYLLENNDYFPVNDNLMKEINLISNIKFEDKFDLKNYDKRFLKKILPIITEENIVTAKENAQKLEKNMPILLKAILIIAYIEKKFMKIGNNILASEYTTITAGFFGNAEVGFVNAMIEKM